MTSRTDPGVRKDPGSAVALAVVLLAVLSVEAIYLEDFWKRDEESRKANDQLEAGNSQMRTPYHRTACGDAEDQRNIHQIK